MQKCNRNFLVGRLRSARLLLPAFAFVLISTSGVSLLSEAPSGAAPVSSANFVSGQGDYLGQGAPYSFPTVTYNGLRNGYPTFTVSNATDSFQVWFAAPAGQPLTPGTYNDVEDFDSRDPGFPGLDVFGDGRGCNTTQGSFTVYQAVYDGSGDVESFSAQLFDHCEGAYPALMGNLSYNATTTPPPLPAEAPEPPESAAVNLVNGGGRGTGRGLHLLHRQTELNGQPERVLHRLGRGGILSTQRTTGIAAVRGVLHSAKWNTTGSRHVSERRLQRGFPFRARKRNMRPGIEWELYRRCDQ